MAHSHWLLCTFKTGICTRQSCRNQRFLIMREDKECQCLFSREADCKWASERAGLEIQLPLHFLFAFKTNSRLLFMFWQRLFPLETSCSAEAVWTITLILIRTAGNCWDCLSDGCCGFHPKQWSCSLLCVLFAPSPFISTSLNLAMLLCFQHQLSVCYSLFCTCVWLGEPPAVPEEML